MKRCFTTAAEAIQTNLNAELSLSDDKDPLGGCWMQPDPRTLERFIFLDYTIRRRTARTSSHPSASNPHYDHCFTFLTKTLTVQWSNPVSQKRPVCFWVTSCQSGDMNLHCSDNRRSYRKAASGSSPPLLLLSLPSPALMPCDQDDLWLILWKQQNSVWVTGDWEEERRQQKLHLQNEKSRTLWHQYVSHSMSDNNKSNNINTNDNNNNSTTNNTITNNNINLFMQNLSYKSAFLF